MDSPITQERPSEREVVFRIPHRVDVALILEGLYITGIAGMLLPGYLRVPEGGGGSVVLAMLGVATLAGLWRLGRAIWLSFSERLLILNSEEVILERRLRGWRSVQCLPVSQLQSMQIKRSSWSGRKKTILFLEFRTRYASISFGRDLTWEEKYWLCEEARAFLGPFAPELEPLPDEPDLSEAA